jgi:hypothetical protein
LPQENDDAIDVMIRFPNKTESVKHIKAVSLFTTKIALRLECFVSEVLECCEFVV